MSEGPTRTSAQYKTHATAHAHATLSLSVRRCYQRKISLQHLHHWSLVMRKVGNPRVRYSSQGGPQRNISLQHLHLFEALEKSDSCDSIYYMSNNVDICKDIIDQ